MGHEIVTGERYLSYRIRLYRPKKKILILSAQARELERAARDTEDYKAELSAQGLISWLIKQERTSHYIKSSRE